MEKKFLEAFDKTKLYCKIDEAKNPKAVIVIVHGLAEHLGRYHHVARFLNENNFSTYRFDHRGHGKSEGKETYYSNNEEITEDVDTVVNLAKKENPDLPIFILGHSMGGLATAAYASRYPNKVNGIILSGALTRNRFRLFRDIPEEMSNDAYLANELAEGVCSDPQVIKDYIDDPFVRKEISVGLARNLMTLVDWLEENPDKFVDPVLIMHGYDDALISQEDSRMFYGEIASPDKSLHIFAKLQHEILNEPIKDQLLTIIVNWINQRI